MWQRILASVVALGYFLGASSAVRADETSDKLVATWVWMAPPGDHDQFWAIANDGGKWTVRGWYKNDQGMETGSFVGVDVKYADGALSYTHRYIKKNFDYKDNVPVLIKVDGGLVKYQWNPSDPKTGRILGRQPKKPLGAVEQFVGEWKTQTPFAGYEQTITIGNERGTWSINGSFLRDKSVVGTTVGEEIKLARGQLSYRARFIKKPEQNWDDDLPTLRTNGETIVLSFTTKAGEQIVRWFSRVPAEPAVVAKKDPLKEPGKDPPPKTQVKFEGTWIGKVDGRWDEIWTVTSENGVWKVTGIYLKAGNEVGSCHGKDVATARDTLTFTRVYDKRPVIELKDTSVVLKVTNDDAEMIVGKIKGRMLKRADAAAVANLTAPPKTPDPKAKSRFNAANFFGPWSGAYPGTTNRLILTLTSEKKDEWTVECFVMSAAEKRVAYFKVPAKFAADGESLNVTPTWTEKSDPITDQTSFVLSAKGTELHVEIVDAKKTDKLAVDLSRMDPRLMAKLKPPSDLVGRPTLLKGNPTDVFKLPDDTPPAKPFAKLEVNLHLYSMAVSTDGKRVALGSKQTLDGKGFTTDLAVWDIEQQKQVWIKKKLVAEQDLGLIQAVAFSGDGKILAAAQHKSAGEDTVRFFDAETGTELRTPAPVKMKVDSLAFNPTKRLLAIGTGGKLVLIDLSTGKSTWTTPQVHRVSINGLAFSPNGETIVTYGWTVDGKGYCVKLFDAAKGTHLHDFGATKQGLATSVVFSNDGQKLAAFFEVEGKPGITIWDVGSKESLCRITGVGPGGNNSAVRSLAFLPDNKTLAAGCAGNHLHLFDATTGQRVGIFPKAFRIGVSDVHVGADGQMLLTNVEADGLVQLWKVSDALALPKK